MPTIEHKPYDHALHRMQRELVYMLQQRICWADKEDVADAMARVRMDYENLEQERRRLTEISTGEASAHDGPGTDG